MPRLSRRSVSDFNDGGNGKNNNDDDDSINNHLRRKRQRVNYNEDEMFSDLDDENIDSNNDRNGDDDEDDDIVKPKKQEKVEVKTDNDADDDFNVFTASKSNSSHNRNNGRTRNGHHNDEDEDVEYSEAGSVNDVEEDEDDEYLSDDSVKKRKSSVSAFVVNDEEDGDDVAYGSRRSRAKRLSRRSQPSGFSASRKTRSNGARRTRSHIADDDEDEDDGNFDDDYSTDKNNSTINANGDKELNPNDKAEVLSLQDELKELQEDSPINSPVQRNLRERNKRVDYTIPPAITNDLQFEQMSSTNSASSPRRRGRFGGFATGSSHFPTTSFTANKNTEIRRLFPTVGPFGGGDVTALFQNGGVPDSLTTLGNADSSDSDDDDLFKPTDPNDTSSKLSVSNNSNTTINPNVITTAINGMMGNPGAGTAPGVLPKKKNTLADTDPLGIDTNIDFSVVGGLDNYINQLKEMITLPLLYPEVYSKFHITPPRGVLFHGPPGTGKTLMARALAASCSSQDKKITFFMRKGADCLSKWVGEAERHLRLLFEEAKQQQPSIIFFDEIDGLAPVRSSKQEQIHASIVSTLLALMDGMDNRGQVIVIGATNRPDSIDPALRRPGRFDREFYFPLPDLKSREEILRIHMRKWDNQLDPNFIKQLSVLTKGYGGADLRALCTESALNSIQRAYPQIYASTDKLKINLNKIKVIPSDFTRALSKIIPSSARSAVSSSAPLPEHVSALLDKNLEKVIEKVNTLIPREKPPTVLEEAHYVDFSAASEDGGFAHQQFLSILEKTRCFRPRLLVSGKRGLGQDYIMNAVLHNLEGFHVQKLDFVSIFSGATLSPESCVIQLIAEVKRHRPSVICIPDIISFLNSSSQSLKSTLSSLIKSISSSDRVLLLGVVEDDALLQLEEFAHISDELEEIFGFDLDESVVKFDEISYDQREKYFEKLWAALKLTPFDFNDLSVRPKKKLKELPKLKITQPPAPVTNGSDLKSEIKNAKEIARNDMRLKNTLKIRLSGLMDIFKVRYKRFKKPAIDDMYLVHLFNPGAYPNEIYQRRDDMILETTTGKLYYNIDLEVIEERLWNGFYSEPRQFLKDIEMILKDAKTSGERDRILKANEMYANAQVGIEDIEAQFPILAQQWKEVRKREKEREREYLVRIKETQIEEEQKTSRQEQPATISEIQEQASGVSELKEDGGIVSEAAAVGVTSPTDVASAAVVAESLESEVNENQLDSMDTSLDKQEQAQSQVQPDNDPFKEDETSTMLPVKPVELGTDTEIKDVLDQVKEENSHKDAAQSENISSADGSAVKSGVAVPPVIAVSTSIVSTSKTDDAQKQDEDEDDDEEEDIQLPAKPTLILDDNKVNEIRQQLLVGTSGWTVDGLEKLNATLMEIVWDDRMKIDKTMTLEKIANVLEKKFSKH
ncbi:hypothetical protein B5S33_g3836 [[Candida] boidinii]|nr:hypothetical protein B5S30_g3956 [[Candida] boidinii]OWB85177.1 hypothetical protein B5S33_g3836 [[Candida] boidinii]